MEHGQLLGVYGLGVGLQFGLKVVDFIFIVQSLGQLGVCMGRLPLGNQIEQENTDNDRDAIASTLNGTLASTFDESTYQSNVSTIRSKHQKKKNISLQW